MRTGSGPLAEYGDTAENPIPVAIETSRGLLVAVLRTGTRKVFAINPMAAARYRDRHSVSRKKSDPGDALVLANILRTDMHAHRPLPDDSDLGRAISVLARAQQNSLWNGSSSPTSSGSLLREYYPAALAAFAAWTNGLCRPEARELLKTAPTPTRAGRLTRAQIQAALKRAGHQRGIKAEAERLREVFRAEWAQRPPLVEDALSKQMLALLIQLDAACTAADQLSEAVEEAFPQHPNAEILLSFLGLGLGIQLAARVLAEIGDDRTRFADARGLKPYAGSSPITRASGKKSAITSAERLAAGEESVVHGRDGGDAQGVALAAPFGHALVERGPLDAVQLRGADEVGDLARHVEGDRQLRSRGVLLGDGRGRAR